MRKLAHDASKLFGAVMPEPSALSCACVGVVWLPTVPGTCVAATDLCPSLNFFCSAAHLDQWRAAHPDTHGQKLTLEQALAGGRKTFEPLLQDAA